MSDPYVGEIQAFAFGFYPRGWLPCFGQILSVQQYTPLFALIGTYYGGDGSRTFALPNLVGKVAMSQGQGPGLRPYTVGDSLGEGSVTLHVGEMPMHTHALQLGNRTSPNSAAGPQAGTGVALDPNFNGFLVPPADTAFAPSSVGPTGGSQPHPNTQPTLAMIYCIAYEGEFPQFG